MKLEELSIELLKWCKYDGVTDRDRCLYRNNICMYTYMETFHLIDAGRVLQNMQLAAWNHGIGSGLFTGIREEKLRKDFAIPNQLSPSVIIGFGYPASRLTGKRKNRLPIHELVYYEIYGESKKIDASKSPCS
jgi:hypothetical protein